MKVYLVGGAVRDLVMGLPVKDKDYVVVGSTTEEMLSLGFQQIGADFPVFFRPYTYENKFISFCERLKVPKEYEKLGHFILNNFDELVNYTNLDPNNKFTLYEKSGLLKQNTLMFDALDFIHCYKMNNDKNELLEIQTKLKEINADSVSSDLKGNEIGAAIRQKRIDKLYQLD